ncbi:MAG: putative DNA modification/repair radical SAM protein, partial [Ruthenibacterium sp.]
IEGLFLSSAVIRSPDHTMEQMAEALALLRGEYHFRGYIHAKTIPGADPSLVVRLGQLADRLSVNIELPTERSLTLLAPDKTRQAILRPMQQISSRVQQSKTELVQYKNARAFAPAGQSTQMIIGATPETDFQILRLTEGLYHKYNLKRVFFSAYIPVAENALLPSLNTKPPLLREHRLYQADWLLRFYHFTADEILDEKNQDFNPYLDPKCNWAIHNMQLFPVDINTCSYEM